MSHRRSIDGESGSVLVLAMLVTIVILGVGLTAIMLSSSGMKVSGNIVRRQEALAVADTGIMRGLTILRANATTDWDCLLGSPSCTSLPCSPTIPYDAQKGYVLCDNATPLENERLISSVPTNLTGNSAADTSYGENLTYTVYIRNDPTEIVTRGTAFDDEDKRVILRSEGRGRDGLSFFGIEAVVTVAQTSMISEAYGSQHLGGPAAMHSLVGTTIKGTP